MGLAAHGQIPRGIRPAMHPRRALRSTWSHCKLRPARRGTRPAYLLGEQDAAGKPREGVEHGTVRNRHEVVDALREAGLEERTT